jgi:hypothetical protein
MLVIKSLEHSELLLEYFSFASVTVENLVLCLGVSLSDIGVLQVQLEAVVLAFKVLVLLLVLVLWVVVLQLVGMLGYLICKLLLIELAEGKQGILVNSGLPVLFLQCQELVGRQWLIQCLKKLIKYFVLLQCFSYISRTIKVKVMYLNVFKSPKS